MGEIHTRIEIENLVLLSLYGNRSGRYHADMTCLRHPALLSLSGNCERPLSRTYVFSQSCFTVPLREVGATITTRDTTFLHLEQQVKISHIWANSPLKWYVTASYMHCSWISYNPFGLASTYVVHVNCMCFNYNVDCVISLQHA